MLHYELVRLYYSIVDLSIVQSLSSEYNDIIETLNHLERCNDVIVLDRY